MELQAFGITTTELVAEVRKVAADNPDRVVGLCQYQNDEGQPGCIIGTALFNLGVDLEYLEEWDYRNGGAGIHVLEILNPEWAIVTNTNLVNAVPDPEARWLRRTQIAQDDRWTWGEAVKRADDLEPGV